MSKFVKSVVALTVSSALACSFAQAARYNLVEIGEVSNHEFSFGQHINARGSVFSTDQTYNLPIQFDQLTEANYNAIEVLARNTNQSVFDLNDIEDSAALRAGNPTANDFAWVVRWLQTDPNTDNVGVQQLLDISSYVDLGSGATEFNGFDALIPNTQTLSRSTRTFVNDVNSQGWLLGNGSAPYLPLDYTFTDSTQDPAVTTTTRFWLRAFVDKAFVSIDGGTNVSSIDAPEVTFGGQSGILGATNNTAVGYASTAISSIRRTNIDNCISANIIRLSTDSDGDGTNDPLLDSEGNAVKRRPDEVCFHLNRTALYEISAYQWQFDDNGQVVSATNLGRLVTPNSEDNRVFEAYATAVNSQGIAVGHAHNWRDENVTEPSANQSFAFYPTLYRNGTAIEIPLSHSEFIDGRMFDINNSGIAVGQTGFFVNGVRRDRFIYVDTNASELSPVLPDTFFSGAGSTARAINDNGLIVGDADFENLNGNTLRRRRGFLFNTNDNSFTDLNTFLSCQQRTNYIINEVRDIDESNRIIATAIVKVPRRDAKGELVTDASGNQLTEDVFRAVRLDPVDGEIEDCSTAGNGEGSVEERTERKGATAGLISTIGLALLTVVRIRRRK
ncbi:DUF3466 family protein [Endozoicomonas sp. G2_1]|uniref:DUF3466 family protein n=1 Tax=Endozoicomonas sp. G2_1 TaxID=2821091 RepID=UPI001ADAFB70|nr:DUF3466 family protein [Endozoicomonas sp. G2_1]MBO9492447.1 DUF3466 family protein [Endozoicomonas sp. G2_1]